MIELVFVIVIIGILAAVAIPKLSATRDDAKTSTAVQNLTIFIEDVGMYYASTDHISSSVNNMSNVDLSQDGCFTVSTSDATSITISSAGTSVACKQAHSLASKKLLIGKHIFRGIKVGYE